MVKKTAKVLQERRLRRGEYNKSDREIKTDRNKGRQID